MRLSDKAVDALPQSVARPRFDRRALKTGILHFGIGAFHRAHQAVYTDDAMEAGDQDWMIEGVSLRSPSVAEQMNPQDGWFTVAAREDAAAQFRLIGSVKRVLVAQDDPESVIAAIARAETRVVTLTITEKGYCRAADGALDFTSAGPQSVYTLLARGLERRRAAGRGGVTLLSCDNLASNGEQLKRLFVQYLERDDAQLRDWVEAHCRFPSSMVDRIVPATIESDIANAAAAFNGVRDEAHVATEVFSQWVIEDDFADGRPRWEVGGADFVRDVRPYETAKLRMLNGAHSALAYIGLRAGYQYVHQAIRDPMIRPRIERLMLDEAAPSLRPAPGQDLAAYARALLRRFENPSLQHRLMQIAMDGSQKIPQRWLEALAFHQTRGSTCSVILSAIDAWLYHLTGANGQVDDPLAEPLHAIVTRSDRTAAMQAIFGGNGVLKSAWHPDHSGISIEASS